MSLDAATVQSRQDLLAALNPPDQSTATTKASSVEDMGSEEFLALMIAQLENQDPTNPMDNMAMMNQLAQFGTVGGIQDLNEAFSGLTNTLTGSSAMQAAQMVGRSVATDSNIGTLNTLGVDQAGEIVYGVQASAEMGNNSQGGVYYVQDANGELVYSGAIAPGGGTQLIQWNGRNAEGEQLPQGSYRISAESFYGGQGRPVSVFAHEQVMSVSVGGNNEITLNLTGGQSLRVEQVKEFF